MAKVKATSAKTTRPITKDRHQAFAALYASTGNKQQAGELVGYAPSTIANSPIPDVKDIVIKNIQDAVISVNCTPKEIMKLLWDCAHKAADETRYRELVLITQELNKMSGNYAPVQVQTKSLNINTTLDKLKEARKEYSEF